MRASIRTGLPLGAFSLLFLSACVTAKFTPAESYKAGDLAPVPVAAVLVLRSPPKEPFRILGDIMVKNAPFHGNDAVILKAREQAATIGAEAIFLKNWGTSFPGGSDAEQAGQVVSLTFTAIHLLPSKDSATR